MHHRYQNTGNSDSTKRPAIDQLNAARAPTLLRKRPIATPKAAQTAHEARHAVARTTVITETCQSMSPPTVAKAANAP
jgi:hypothetical protein